MNEEEEVDKAPSKCSKAAEHTMRVLTLELIKHLHDFFENKSLYAVEDDKLTEWSVAVQFRLTAPVLPLVLATLEKSTLMLCRSSGQLFLVQR